MPVGGRLQPYRVATGEPSSASIRAYLQSARCRRIPPNGPGVRAKSRTGCSGMGLGIRRRRCRRHVVAHPFLELDAVPRVDGAVALVGADRAPLADAAAGGGHLTLGGVVAHQFSIGPLLPVLRSE